MMVPELESIAYEKITTELQPQQTQEKPISISSPRKQNPLFALTLDEFQYKSGKSLGSMNMDEFLSSMWNAEGNQASLQPNLNEVSSGKSILTLPQECSFSIPTPLCKKTVDEVWFEIHKDQPQQNNFIDIGDHVPPQSQQTLGEMTLEDFLIKAGVVQGSPRYSSKHGMPAPVQNICGDILSNNTGLDANFGMGNSTSSESCNHRHTVNNVSTRTLTAYHMFTQSSMLMGESSKSGEMGSPLESGEQKGRKRSIDGPVEVVVERRQRRMIKNRESAARSRARKQAYTVELEVELNRLREENERLKESLGEADNRRRLELLSVKQSTKAQKIAKKLATVKRTKSLA